MQRWAQAVRVYVQACELRPDHVKAHVNTSRCYQELEDYDNALTYGQRAEQINGNLSEVQEVLGDVYEAKRDHDQAISAYKRALEIDSGNSRIMTSLARSYLRSQQVEPAEELLVSAIGIDARNGRAHKLLGYCYLQYYDRLTESYTEARDSDADKAHLKSIWGQGREKVLRAIENYKRAIAIDEQDWDAHRGLGVAYMIEGKTENDTIDQEKKDMAIFYWRTSLQINPDQPRGDRLRKLIAKYRAQ